MKGLDKWVDRRWLAVGGEKHLVFIAFSPVLAMMFVSRSLWWVGAIPSLLILGYFLWRGYRVGRLFMRPVDRARDEWAATNQGNDYKAAEDKQRG